MAPRPKRARFPRATPAARRSRRARAPARRPCASLGQQEPHHPGGAPWGRRPNRLPSRLRSRESSHTCCAPLLRPPAMQDVLSAAFHRVRVPLVATSGAKSLAPSLLSLAAAALATAALDGATPSSATRSGGADPGTREAEEGREVRPEGEGQVLAGNPKC